MANRSPIRVACTMIWRRAGVRPGCTHLAACGQVSSPARLPSAASTWMRTPAADAVTVSRAPLPGSPAARSPEYGASWRIAGSMGWPVPMTASRSANTSGGSLPRPRKMSSSVSGLPGCGRVPARAGPARAVACRPRRPGPAGASACCCRAGAAGVLTAVASAAAGVSVLSARRAGPGGAWADSRAPAAAWPAVRLASSCCWAGSGPASRVSWTGLVSR